VIVFEAFDQVHLPQRFGSVQRSRADTLYEIRKFAGAAGRRKGRATQMIREVEVGIVGPHRAAYVERWMQLGL
jgi:hypothetical protein